MAVEGSGGASTLNTFGAVLRFAIEMEETTSHFYTEAAANSQSEPVAGLLLELSAGRDRRAQEVARIRRENVAEMILEPVVGMDGAAYSRDLMPAGNVSDADRLRMAALLEGDAERFYLDASNCLSIAEVNRLLKRLARECARAKAKAESQIGS
jgi:hypothetical protein